MAPMDGVTDFAFRHTTALVAKPDVMFTEFTNATGLFYAPDRLLRDFEYSEIERPIVAQIYGNNPEDFYKATHVVCELGFDGVDINMGCPAKTVANNNCGAKLITLPDLALQIMAATRQATIDWANGQKLEDLKIRKARLIDLVKEMNIRRTGQETVARRRIPFSVKTRIGFDAIVIESWVQQLLQEAPAVISIHGRTLKQMYKGFAHWDAIQKAGELIHQQGNGTLVLGNGDIKSIQDACTRIEQSGVDGALIGRASIGNPWIFKNPGKISIQERFHAALEHAKHYQSIRGSEHFQSIRKHLTGYLSCFPEAARYRMLALKTNSLEELKEALQ